MNDFMILTKLGKYTSHTIKSNIYLFHSVL